MIHDELQKFRLKVLNAKFWSQSFSSTAFTTIARHAQDTHQTLQNGFVRFSKGASQVFVFRFKMLEFQAASGFSIRFLMLFCKQPNFSSSHRTHRIEQTRLSTDNGRIETISSLVIRLSDDEWQPSIAIAKPIECVLEKLIRKATGDSECSTERLAGDGESRESLPGATGIDNQGVCRNLPGF